MTRMQSPNELYGFHMEILESLFPDRWFYRSPPAEHPAYIRWKVCRDFVLQGGHFRLSQFEAFSSILARCLLDTQVFMTVMEGKASEQILGRLDAFGDQAVQRKIRTRITDPSQFEDVMTELAVAAWYKANGSSMDPLEQEGFPDLRLGDFNGSGISYVECKRIRSPAPERIAKQIQKANNQIKTAGAEAFGAAILDISALVGFSRVENDDIPAKVSETVAYARAALAGNKNRRVSKALLVWDDQIVHGFPPGHTVCAFRRRVLPVDHEIVPGVRQLPHDFPVFKGGAAILTLDWDPDVDSTRVSMSKLGERCQQVFEIKANELVDACQKQDKYDVAQKSDNESFYIFSRRVQYRGEPSHLLVGLFRERNSSKVLFALRVPARLTAQLENSRPTQMLAALAEEYGYLLSIGSRSSRLFTFTDIRVPNDRPKEFVSVQGMTDRKSIACQWMALVRREETFTAYVAFAFCLDEQRLLADFPA